MKSEQERYQYIAERKELEESPFLRLNIEYKQRRTSAIVFLFEHKVYAYVNHCMHMQRPLDCQEDSVFDKERKRLRCTMHGFLFEPTTGACLSPVCEGQHLQALRVVEQDGAVYFREKTLRTLPEGS